MSLSRDRRVALFKLGLMVSASLCWSSRGFCQQGVKAIITDTAGVVTEVSELKSDQYDFAAYDVERSGFPITTSQFQRSRRWPKQGLGGRVERWIPFSRLTNLSFDAKGNPRKRIG
jgi:hypothetical protein